MKHEIGAPRPQIAILLYEGLTALDFVAPHQAWTMHADIHLVSSDGREVVSDSGIVMHATCSFADCPRKLDVMFVPGGMSTFELMMDKSVVDFVRELATHARYVTSVCNGAVVLAAAGLLDGYKAATHWATVDMLKAFANVEVVEDRVVVDRNRLTGGGVTAGLDFGLVVLEHLLGEQVAKNTQLILEYNPAPPYNAGHPSIADATTISQVEAILSEFNERGMKNALQLQRENALAS